MPQLGCPFPSSVFISGTLVEPSFVWFLEQEWSLAVKGGGRFASIFMYSSKSTLLINSGRQLPVFSMSVAPCLSLATACTLLLRNQGFLQLSAWAWVLWYGLGPRLSQFSLLSPPSSLRLLSLHPGFGRNSVLPVWFGCFVFCGCRCFFRRWLEALVVPWTGRAWVVW